MRLKKLEKTDSAALVELMNICFGKSVDVENPGRHFADDKYWKNAWGFEVDGRLVAAHVCHDIEVKIRDRVFPASFVLHTVTLPSFRRQGLTRRFFLDDLARERSRGRRLIFLEPFSDSLFKKFGFEFAFNSFCMEFPSEALREFPVNRDFQLIDGKVRDNALLESFCSRYFDERMKFSRYNDARAPGVFSWRRHFGRDKTVSLAIDGNSRPVGMMVSEQKSRTLVVELMLFELLEALECLGEYLRRFMSQVDFVRISNVPEDFPFFLLMETRCSQKNCCKIAKTSPIMGRIVDLEGLLEGLVHRERNTSIVLGIEDSLVPENDASFAITRSGVEKTRQTPEIKMKQCDLLTLLTGSRSVFELYREKKISLQHTVEASWQCTEIPDLLKLLARLFPRRPTNWNYL